MKKKEKTFEDGVLVAEAVVGEEVQTESVNKVVALARKTLWLFSRHLRRVWMRFLRTV